MTFNTRSWQSFGAAGYKSLSIKLYTHFKAQWFIDISLTSDIRLSEYPAPVLPVFVHYVHHLHKLINQPCPSLTHSNPHWYQFNHLRPPHLHQNSACTKYGNQLTDPHTHSQAQSQNRIQSTVHEAVSQSHKQNVFRRHVAAAHERFWEVIIQRIF